MPDYTVLRQKDGSRFFFPYIVQVPGFIGDVFPVPVKDAVGTINLNNAITIVKFRGDTTPDLDVVAKNFLGEVDGDFIFGFCPVFSDEIIAYTQTRWAVVANIKSGKVETPVLTMSLDDIIGGIVSLDTARDLFVVNKLIPARKGSRQMLNIMRLEDVKFISLGEIDGGGTWPEPQPWLVHDKKIITYDSAANRLLCHDADLKPATHPFVDIFNRKSGSFRKLKEMVIHPTLPFGLVVEVGKDIDTKELDKLPSGSAEQDALLDKLAELSEIHALYLLRWDTDDPEKQYTPIHTDTLSLLPPLRAKSYGHFTFSPKGDWLVFGHEDVKKNEFGNFIGGKYHPFFIGLPVDEKKPLFFGDPLFLGRTMKSDAQYKTSAWATDPTAFVAADGYAMYKWDLGNLHRAHTVPASENPISLE